MTTEVKCPKLGGYEGDVGNLHWSDVLVIIVYFLGVIAVGIWSSFKNRGSVEGRPKSTKLIRSEHFGRKINSVHGCLLLHDGCIISFPWVITRILIEIFTSYFSINEYRIFLKKVTERSGSALLYLFKEGVIIIVPYHLTTLTPYVHFSCWLYN